MGNVLSPIRKMKTRELESRIQELEAENKHLKTELESKTDSKPVNSQLSKERLNQIVEKLIKDEDVNIDYLPDFVERKIYTNVFNLLINLLDETLNTTGIDLLGHRIEFDFVAKQ